MTQGLIRIAQPALRGGTDGADAVPAGVIGSLRGGAPADSAAGGATSGLAGVGRVVRLGSFMVSPTVFSKSAQEAGIGRLGQHDALQTEAGRRFSDARMGHETR